MIPLKDLNPTRHFPFVTIAIIVFCVIGFLWQTSLSSDDLRRAIYSFGLIPAVLTDEARLPPELALIPPSATILSSMFLHADIMHLGGNLLYLWIFGNNIEDRLGPVRFTLFYGTCGLAAAVAQIVPEPSSQIPMIGASGAISGVLGAYLILFPRARVVVFVPFSFMFIHQIRAGWLLGIWFLFQLIAASFSSAEMGGVAWWAHVGGFAAGMLLILPARRRASR